MNSNLGERCADMTKAKIKAVEVIDGVEVRLAPRAASGYYGVIPSPSGNGKWQARVYKKAKQRWDPLPGAHATAQGAAVAAALAAQRLIKGEAVHSPLQKRARLHGTRCPHATRAPNPSLSSCAKAADPLAVALHRRHRSQGWRGRGELDGQLSSE